MALVPDPVAQGADLHALLGGQGARDPQLPAFAALVLDHAHAAGAESLQPR